ncbi:uncharacterized protein LOC143206685 [Rhynchophorus ferrugineus]|uniref:uncharacterized protein LOC143206685 n=1 Tax=Rhynchophorus ferrugineus TaxID=354439 RepID=UPI003FCE2C23
MTLWMLQLPRGRVRTRFILDPVSKSRPSRQTVGNRKRARRVFPKLLRTRIVLDVTLTVFSSTPSVCYATASKETSHFICCFFKWPRANYRQTCDAADSSTKQTVRFGYVRNGNINSALLRAGVEFPFSIWRCLNWKEASIT